MKLRRFILPAFLIFLLAACNYTLAEDVTPPPGYVPPTPMPTLVLSPAQAPSVESGKAIYAEKCAACHGETGLGDGAQGIQLGVTVPAFGLPEIARPATLADWFTTVTRGRMDRFMPPFASLSDEQRWDVVAYAMSFHINEELSAQGKQLFEANCKDCSTDFFKDQSKMSALSEVDLARIARQGNESVPAFGANLSEDELWAVAAYLRTLAFDYSKEQAAAPAPTSTPEAASVTDTPAVVEAGTPSGEETPVASTEQATAGAGTEQAQPTAVAQAGFGTISGSIENKTGESLPADMKVTLHAFDHGADKSTGPQEVFSQEATVNADGTYSFANVEMPANRIFLSEVVVDGVTLQSKFAVAKEGDTAISLPVLTLYGMTDDTSLLAVDEVRMFVDYGDTDIQVYGVYSFRNPSDKTVVVDTKGNTDIPFIKMPEGTSTMGYETLQDSQPITNTDKGMAIAPSEGTYGLLAFTSIPKQEKYDIVQPFVLPASSFTLFLPEGVTAQGNEITDEGAQNIQNFNFQVYTAQNVAAGETLKFSVSGEPKQTTETGTSGTTEPAANTNTRQNLLIGGGVLGIALILAGVWLYLRDRKAGDELDEEEDEQEFESSEDVLDAIVALDDLHRAGKISDEAYQKRRAELKEILKGMM
jgi:mono/diheme cytochrome c family protein